MGGWGGKELKEGEEEEEVKQELMKEKELKSDQRERRR